MVNVLNQAQFISYTLASPPTILLNASAYDPKLFFCWRNIITIFIPALCLCPSIYFRHCQRVKPSHVVEHFSSLFFYTVFCVSIILEPYLINHPSILIFSCLHHGEFPVRNIFPFSLHLMIDSCHCSAVWLWSKIQLRRKADFQCAANVWVCRWVPWCVCVCVRVGGTESTGTKYTFRLKRVCMKHRQE